MTTTKPRIPTKRPRLHRHLYLLAYLAATAAGIFIGGAVALWIFWALTALLGSIGAALAGIGIGAFLLGRVVYETLRD